MPNKCAAPGCNNHPSSSKRGFAAYNKENGISFHRFPTDTNVRKKWEDAIVTARSCLGQPDIPNWTASKAALICSKHFLKEDFEVNGWSVMKKLCKGVTPTIFKLGPKLVFRKKIQEKVKSSNNVSLLEGLGSVGQSAITDTTKTTSTTSTTVEQQHQERTIACDTSVDSEKIQYLHVPPSASTSIECSCTLNSHCPIHPSQCITPTLSEIEASASRKRCHRSLSLSSLNTDSSLSFEEISESVPLSNSSASNFEYVPNLLNDNDCTLPDTPRKVKLKQLIADAYKMNNELKIKLSKAESEIENLKNSNNKIIKENVQLKIVKNNLNEINRLLDIKVKVLRGENMEKSRKIDSQSSLIIKLRKKSRTLQNHVYRQNLRLKTYKEQIDHRLEHESIDALEMLKKAISPGAAGMLNRVKTEKKRKGEINNEYDPQTKVFAQTLYSYSPRAYNFIRTSFNNALPYPKTLRGWKSHQAQIQGGGEGCDSAQNVPKYIEGATTPHPSPPLPLQILTLWDRTSPAPEPRAGSAPESHHIGSGPGVNQEALDTTQTEESANEGRMEGRNVKLALSLLSLKEGVHFDAWS